MTQEEIIRMAREAGMSFAELFGAQRIIDGWLGDLERFADLVAAHERNKYLDKLAEAIDLSVKAEREACAKVLEDNNLADSNAIWFVRARGEK